MTRQLRRNRGGIAAAQRKTSTSMGAILNPHDALFKAVLGQPEHARGTLRAIAPGPLAEALDWSTLTLRPGSFVDSAFSHQHTDLLYSVTWRDGDEAVVHLLFEHQSTPPSDGLMAHRLLRYQGRIWDRWRIDHPKRKKLPMIFPIVMYHGAAPWSEPRSFDALLDVPAGVRPAVEPYLVRFTYLLHDLSKISDDELRQGAMMTALAKLVAMCFKYARTGADFVEHLARWMNVVREVARAPNGLEALAQVMHYILEVNEHVGSEALQELLEREIGSEAKDAIVTTGQQLIEQGRQQGIEQGRQQGRQQGIQEFLLRLLRQRFGDAVDPRVEQRIAGASAEQVEVWSVRVLSAASLAELLGDGA
jgi:predicted transposase/invertase (TIGR01784 family)